MSAYVEVDYWVSGYAEGDADAAFDANSPIQVVVAPSPVRIGFAASTTAPGALGVVTASPRGPFRN